MKLDELKIPGTERTVFDLAQELILAGREFRFDTELREQWDDGKGDEDSWDDWIGDIRVLDLKVSNDDGLADWYEIKVLALRLDQAGDVLERRWISPDQWDAYHSGELLTMTDVIYCPSCGELEELDFKAGVAFWSGGFDKTYVSCLSCQTEFEVKVLERKTSFAIRW